MCKCYPTLSYFIHDSCNISTDHHFLSNFHTYGILLGIGISFLLFTASIYLKWDLKKLFINLVVPCVIGMLCNNIENIVFNKSLMSLSTTPFVIGFTITHVFFNDKNIKRTILGFLFLGLAIVRIGCHVSGDGHWGKEVENNDYLYPIFKNCNYAHNIIKSGTKIDNCTSTYNRRLETGHYPIALFESILFFTLGLLVLSWRTNKFIIWVILFFVIKLITSQFYDEYNYFTLLASFILVGLTIFLKKHAKIIILKQ